MKPLLSVEGLSAGYSSDRSIIDEISFSVQVGECCAILGASGSGKTTLLRAILGLLTVHAGTIRWPAVENGSGPPRGLLGYIPQNLGLVRNRTVRDNVLLGALGRLNWLQTLAGRFSEREITDADEALARVGLAGRGGERIEDLSGGERRRVAIARALLQRPKALLADEFVAEIDRVTAREIIALLKRLRESEGLTLLFVDHDIESACRIADRVIVLAEGRKVRELAADEADPARLAELFRPEEPAGDAVGRA